MMSGLKLSHIVSGAIAVLLAYTSSAAIVFQAIDTLGATQAEANSWMLVLGLGMGLSTLVLTLRYKMPILTAWSTPGAALLVISLQGVPMGEAIGAFVSCGLLLTLTGLTGWFEKISRFIPDAIGSAMLAGILFRFGLGIFASMEDNLPLVAVMCVTYLLGRRFFARFAIPSVLLAGIVFCALTGAFATGESFDLSLAQPVFTMPVFSLSALIGIALPLYIVTMSSQNMPGVVTLKAAGYQPPVSSAITATGLATLILAPFGGYAFNLAAITAAICAGPEADENPATRWKAAMVTGVIYCIVGLMGAAVISLFLIAPNALVVTVAGLALLNTVAGSLSAALKEVDQREAALVTFMTTVSGISFMSIGAPVWALLFGGLTSLVLTRKTAVKA
ncbi:benzoate/H(+) symporter BenE family transporter [Celeribacter halophilus]|uniref:Benzoate/H(+) symporter BenE family transporter n=1 Tax=Celeribacter halophilus TaxID=576117 RepID=A0AAW7XX42_9RHOB|nr:benzoate/H(+) symporter BenE family transporter [Celeribacter halophilus]MDO6458615.1 benzoate/H(+) symporter BenE family transporter [Celeribacter halophilus]MDO6725045.1 benzoate/H(+) symporter BenE family transporter [Celeribacter halophilus]